MRLAIAALACACIPDPHGRCASDADCSAAPAGLFCAEGICQGPPRGTVEAVPSRAFARAETLHVRAHVNRAHGTATGRIVFGGTGIDAQREPDGALGADVPLSLAPAAVEGAVPFSVELRDDLGHVTALPASVLVDDKPPRVSIDPASVPSAAVLRGTQVSLRATADDLTAVTIAGATKNADGSFTIAIDTRTAPPAATIFDVPITATDAVGNTTTVQASIPITRVKFMARHPTNRSIQSIVLTDTEIWGLADQSEFWFIRRSDGTALLRPLTGGNAFPQLATDGARLFFARSDNQICRMDSSGAIQCNGTSYPTMNSGPILEGTTAIVSTTGTTSTAMRLYAWVDSPSLGIVPSSQLADFTGNTPAIAPDGTIYSGAVQKIVATTFDGLSWSNNPLTPSETPHYSGAPAFRSNQVLLSTTAATMDTFTTPIAAAPTSIQVATLGTTLSSPTIAADGTAVLTTNAPRAIALRPDGTVRWTVSLPDQATAPPSHGAGNLIYIGALSGDILALALEGGATVWSYNAGAPIRGPLAPGCDGILYAATDGAIVALVTDAAGLADSPWPRAAHDVRGTSDARRPLRSATGTCLE